MNPDLLALRGMKLPDPVGWWPLAPGWWILAVLLVVIIWGAVHVLRTYRESVGYRAGKVLQRLKQDYQQGVLDKQALLSELNQLLKRTALVRFSANEVARLSGDEWVAFLLKHSKAEYAQDLQVLAYGLYQKKTEYDPASLITACEQWIKSTGRSQ